MSLCREENIGARERINNVGDFLNNFDLTDLKDMEEYLHDGKKDRLHVTTDKGVG